MAGNLTQKDFARSNPIDLSTITDSIAAFVKMMHLHDSQFQCCAPAVVLGYNSLTNQAIVQPIIRMKTNLGNSIPRKPIVIGVIGSGGVKQGDFGWMIASDFDRFMDESVSEAFNEGIKRLLENKDSDIKELNEQIKTFIKGEDDRIDPIEDITIESPTNNIHQYRNGFFLPQSLSTGGGGDGGGVVGSMFQYHKDTLVIDGGYIMAPRQLIEVQPLDLNTLSSFPEYVYIDVSHPDNSARTASIGTSSENTDVQTAFPLYRFDVNKDILIDFRGIPVIPIYELP